MLKQASLSGFFVDANEIAELCVGKALLHHEFRELEVHHVASRLSNAASVAVAQAGPPEELVEPVLDGVALL